MSLRPDVRSAWMAQNPLPPELRYYSLVTLPTPDRVSRIIEKSYLKLGAIDWRNDSQVIYSDQIIPGSTLLGFLNADHWAIAVPLEPFSPDNKPVVGEQERLSARGHARSRAAFHRGGPAGATAGQVRRGHRSTED